ncbi:MAG: hypothetical protein FWG34_14520 [Oscillospiraceae bacterium]|nr:hypothetical protein [Oscillospiraceae bacterium]
MSDFYTNTYNPDVLSCLANLSNDEVFTPPDIVNKMLDMLPQELFGDRNAMFLDPACKSGVFLREIAKRLLVGLENEIPDLQERIGHIFRKQLYGIAITEMTSLLSRRSVYCSKFPNGKYSIKGGVCYFLWDRDNGGDCKIVSHLDNDIANEMTRPLLEEGCSTLIRFNSAISLYRRVSGFGEKSFAEIISANDPFGFDVRVENSYRRVKPTYALKPFANSVCFYYNGWRNDGIGYIERSKIVKNPELIDTHKILIPKAWGIGNISNDWLNPIKAEYSSCCTETYLVVGTFNTEDEMNNAYSYMQTKFFHALISLIKISQNTMKKAYTFVPIQNFTEPWTDEKLYAKYGLTNDEVSFIENMVRPIELNDGNGNDAEDDDE